MAEVSERDPKVQYWLEQIECAQKDHNDYYERGKGVNERYLDKKDTGVGSSAAHKMNVLWSNVETIKPALYAKTPNPKTSRRFRDKDPVGKWAAIVLERSLGYHLDAYDCDYNFRNCVQDYLLPGRGQIWVSYEPKIVPGPAGADGKPTEQLAWEYAKDEHLNWKDFLHNSARTWDEVWWVAKRGYLSKDEVEKHPWFKKGAADKLTFEEQKDDTSTADKQGRTKKAAIWEIWSKAHKKVVCVSKNCPEILAERDPPIDFENFFPCPRPLTTTCTTDSIIPTADFCQYQNQADEIDRLTQRINLLTDALRVVGFYDGSLDGDAPGSGMISQLFAKKGVNEMIPVSNWAMFAQQGGFDGSVAFFPLKDVIETLKQCYESREMAKAVMYEITGISDIVRGASDAQETATAQQIKSQWGSLRIRDRQADVQRFVRDVMRLKSEIIAEQFQLDTLKAMSNAPLLMAQEKQALQQRQQMQQQAQQAMQSGQIPPEQAQQLLASNPQLQQMMAPLSLDELQRLQEPTWEEVYQLLKDQKLRSFRIDIETDSTINADEQEEKQARTEFLMQLTTAIQTWGPMVLQFPKLAPLFGAALTFATRAFPKADVLETEIEALVENLNQQALVQPNGPPQPPDPKMEAEKAKAEHEGKAREADAALQQEQHQFERDRMVHERGKMQMEAEDAQREREAKLQAEQMKTAGQVETAKAQRPSVDELSAIVGPLVQFMESVVKQMQQTNAEAIQQIAESSAQTQASISEAIDKLAQAASAPKQIIVQRDAQGRVSGGTATRLN